MLVELEDGATEEVGVEALPSVMLLEGLLPVHGRELEDPARGPARQQAEQVAQVARRLERMELRAGQERHAGRVDLGGVVVAAEEPVFPADDLAAERALAVVV